MTEYGATRRGVIGGTAIGLAATAAPTLAQQAMGTAPVKLQDPRCQSASKRDPLSKMARRSRNAPCAARGVGRAQPDRRRAQRKAS